MIEARDGLGFELEPLPQRGVRCHVFRQYFDRDRTVQAGIARFIDFSHAARAEG
jgi:hypothetical protein